MLKERFSALYRATATALILTCAVSSASLPVFAANTGSSSSSSSSVSSASSGSGYIPSEVIKAQKEAEERKIEEQRVAAAKQAAAEQAAIADAEMQKRAALIAAGAYIPQPVRGEILPDTTGYTILAVYSTKYDDSLPRANNITLAANRINGVVLNKGDVFSFTHTILPRTIENGYVAGPIFVQKEHSKGIGGGICQVSSTLYACTLTAGIPALERHEHGLPVTYIPAGMDATIDGTRLDFKFANPYDKPLMITATPNYGVLTVGLWLKN